MEREVQAKQIEWPTIVEFFTKRGRPLSKDEIQKLVDEDRKEKEIEIEIQRAEEEGDRRRMERIAQELQDEEGRDYDEGTRERTLSFGRGDLIDDGED